VVARLTDREDQDDFVHAPPPQAPPVAASTSAAAPSAPSLKQQYDDWLICDVVEEFGVMDAASKVKRGPLWQKVSFGAALHFYLYRRLA